MQTYESAHKEIVFIDTNAVGLNASLTRLFDRRGEIGRVAEVYDLVIPRTVLDEIKAHKKGEFEKRRSSLIKNDLTQLLGYDLEKAKALKFDELWETILRNEAVKYDVCDMLSAQGFFDEFYSLSIGHQPPFEEKTDKGFKDACIAYEIKSYINERIVDSPVYVVTNDGKLQEYLNTQEGISVVCQFKDLPKMKPEEQPATMVQQEAPTRDDSNSMPTIADESRRKAINDLLLSGSFSFTHAAIQRLMSFRDSLTQAEKVEILKGAVENNQISYVLSDQDVAEFMTPLFQSGQNCLSDKQYCLYVDCANLPNERLDDQGNVRFSQSERRSFIQFIDQMIDRIESRGWNSAVRADADFVVKKLMDLIAEASLDPRLLTWQRVAEALVDGDVTVTDAIAPLNVVADFANYISGTSSAKRAKVMEYISSRVEALRVDYGEVF